MSKYGVISVFPVFGPNTGKYGPEKTPYLVTFHAVNFYSVMYSVNSVRYFGPIIRDLISYKLSIICKLIGKFKNGIPKRKPRKCPCRICKTFFPKHRICSIFELSTIFFDLNLTFLKTRIEWSREISP